MKTEKLQSELDRMIQSEMSDPAFRKAWKETELADQIQRAILSARAGSQMTQEELSRRTGLRQSNISRIESGSVSPSLQTLQRLAEGLGMTLRIEFVPKDASQD